MQKKFSRFIAIFLVPCLITTTTTTYSFDIDSQNKLAISAGGAQDSFQEQALTLHCVEGWRPALNAASIKSTQFLLSWFRPVKNTVIAATYGWAMELQTIPLISMLTMSPLGAMIIHWLQANSAAGIVAGVGVWTFPRRPDDVLLSKIHEVMKNRPHDWVTITDIMTRLNLGSTLSMRHELTRHADNLASRNKAVKMGGDVVGNPAEYHYLPPESERIFRQSLGTQILRYSDAEGIEAATDLTQEAWSSPPDVLKEAKHRALRSSIRALGNLDWALYDWHALEGDSSSQAIAKRLEILERACAQAIHTRVVFVRNYVNDVAWGSSEGRHFQSLLSALEEPGGSQPLEELFLAAGAFGLGLPRHLAILIDGHWPDIPQRPAEVSSAFEAYLHKTGFPLQMAIEDPQRSVPMGIYADESVLPRLTWFEIPNLLSTDASENPSPIAAPAFLIHARNDNSPNIIFLDSLKAAVLEELSEDDVLAMFGCETCVALGGYTTGRSNRAFAGHPFVRNDGKHLPSPRGITNWLKAQPGVDHIHLVVFEPYHYPAEYRQKLLAEFRNDPKVSLEVHQFGRTATAAVRGGLILTSEGIGLYERTNNREPYRLVHFTPRPGISNSAPAAKVELLARTQGLSPSALPTWTFRHPLKSVPAGQPWRILVDGPGEVRAGIRTTFGWQSVRDIALERNADGRWEAIMAGPINVFTFLWLEPSLHYERDVHPDRYDFFVDRPAAATVGQLQEAPGFVKRNILPAILLATASIGLLARISPASPTDINIPVRIVPTATKADQLATSLTTLVHQQNPFRSDTARQKAIGPILKEVFSGPYEPHNLGDRIVPDLLRIIQTRAYKASQSDRDWGLGWGGTIVQQTSTPDPALLAVQLLGKWKVSESRSELERLKTYLQLEPQNFYQVVLLTATENALNRMAGPVISEINQEQLGADLLSGESPRRHAGLATLADCIIRAVDIPSEVQEIDLFIQRHLTTQAAIFQLRNDLEATDPDLSSSALLVLANLSTDPSNYERLLSQWVKLRYNGALKSRQDAARLEATFRLLRRRVQQDPSLAAIWASVLAGMVDQRNPMQRVTAAELGSRRFVNESWVMNLRDPILISPLTKFVAIHVTSRGPSVDHALELLMRQPLRLTGVQQDLLSVALQSLQADLAFGAEDIATRTNRERLLAQIIKQSTAFQARSKSAASATHEEEILESFFLSDAWTEFMQTASPNSGKLLKAQAKKIDKVFNLHGDLSRIIALTVDSLPQLDLEAIQENVVSAWRAYSREILKRDNIYILLGINTTDQPHRVQFASYVYSVKNQETARLGPGTPIQILFGRRIDRTGFKPEMASFKVAGEPLLIFDPVSRERDITVVRKMLELRKNYPHPLSDRLEQLAEMPDETLKRETTRTILAHELTHEEFERQKARYLRNDQFGIPSEAWVQMDKEARIDVEEELPSRLVQLCLPRSRDDYAVIDLMAMAQRLIDGEKDGAPFWVARYILNRLDDPEGDSRLWPTDYPVQASHELLLRVLSHHPDIARPAKSLLRSTYPQIPFEEIFQAVSELEKKLGVESTQRDNRGDNAAPAARKAMKSILAAALFQAYQLADLFPMVPDFVPIDQWSLYGQAQYLMDFRWRRLQDPFAALRWDGKSFSLRSSTKPHPDEQALDGAA